MIRLPATRDKGNERGEILWRWLTPGLQAPEPAISRYLTGAPAGDLMITGDNPLTVGTARSFTGFLPPHHARSPRGHRAMGDHRAMADLLPASTIASPRRGNPALLMDNAMTWLREQPGGCQPLRDHADGPFPPDRAPMTRILVVEDHEELQRALRTGVPSHLVMPVLC
jgi:hypothetical protein